MSFLTYPFAQAKKPFAEVLPDQRKRLTRYFQVTATNLIPPGLDDSPGTADDWPDAPTGWTGLLLTYKKFEDELAQKGADTRPILTLIFEQISATAETPVGEPTMVVNQYGYQEATFEWVQFSSNAPTFEVPGVTTAPSPYTTLVLRDQEAPDDGTLRRIKRTYVEGGELSDTSEIRFGGKVVVRTLRYLNEVPPTPSGYTLVGPGVDYINGLPVYSYQFVQVSGGGGSGTGGVVSQGFTDSSGGTVAFNPASPNSATGAVICTTNYVSTLAITSNPVTQPTGFVLFAVNYEDETGLRMWTTKSGFGSGLILDETTIQAVGALVVYHRIALGTAPTTPSATIGGTVTLFDSSDRNQDGYMLYDRRWSEGDGQSSITTDGDPDGALLYTVVTYTLAASTPSYPGSGTAYLIRLTQQPQNGYFQNTAVYKKPPATVTFRKMYKFLMPGLASFSGVPVEFNQSPPVTMDILASVEVSYATSQVTTTPFTVEAYARLNASWIPYTNPGVSPTPGSPPADTTTGPPQGYSESLGGYLAGASGISDTDQYFNGVFVATYSSTLASSTPSSRPTGSTTLAVDNDPYITATDGTIIYRRMVTTYSF